MHQTCGLSRRGEISQYTQCENMSTHVYTVKHARGYLMHKVLALLTERARMTRLECLQKQ